MVKAIFFDWFNTLACYHPPREELHSNLLREFGINVSPQNLLTPLLAADKYLYGEHARMPMQKRAPDDLARLYFHYGELMFSGAGIKVDRELMGRIIKRWPELQQQMHFVLYDDVIPTLKKLKEHRYIFGLLTNASKEAVAVQEKLGIKSYLDFTVTAEEAGADKPSPRIFQMALEKAGVKASDAVHVGDQYEIDVTGARGVGIEPIMIDRYNLYPEVKDCTRIRTLPELEQHLA